jgi:hypothetical protein
MLIEKPSKVYAVRILTGRTLAFWRLFVPLVHVLPSREGMMKHHCTTSI